MILEIDGRRKRFERFQTYKIVGKKRVILLYDKPDMWSKINIDLDSGGKGGSSWALGKMVYGTGESIREYPISFVKLDAETQAKVVECVQYILENGDPVDNDEHIYT